MLWELLIARAILRHLHTREGNHMSWSFGDSGKASVVTGRVSERAQRAKQNKTDVEQEHIEVAARSIGSLLGGVAASPTDAEANDSTISYDASGHAGTSAAFTFSLQVSSSAPPASAKASEFAPQSQSDRQPHG